MLGNVFGTIYDISTILILWFAGASAMAGLLNIVPRYLPRYGMAPEWTRAMRPLVIVFTIIAFAITVIFKADVNAQGGAYATGVLVLMTSAAVAVTISALRRKQKLWGFVFGLITLVFAYTTIVNVIERPDGIKIASFFIGLVILVSLLSRIVRTTELRVDQFEIDEDAIASSTKPPRRARFASSLIGQRKATKRNTGERWLSIVKIITCRRAIPFCSSKSNLRRFRVCPHDEG